MTRKDISSRAAALAQHHEAAYGPQLPGGTYRLDGRQYEVLEAWSDARTGVPYTRVRWWGHGQRAARWPAAWDPRTEVLNQPASRYWPRRSPARAARPR